MNDSAPDAPPPLPRAAVESVGLLAILAVGYALIEALGVRHALDCDEVNLAYGVGRFDLAHHQPHPPGYLGYVALLKSARLVTGTAPLAATRFVARLCWFGLVACTFGAARCLPGSRPSVSLWAAALAALNPISLYYAIDAQTHGAEACMAAALAWALLTPSPITRARVVVIAAILAIGGSFRPSFALVAIAPVLLVHRRDPTTLVRIAALGAVGTLAWLVPTVMLTPGGLRAYVTINQELAGTYVDISSPLSGSADARHVVTNLHGAAIWSALAIGPALVGWLVASASVRDAQAAPLRLLASMAMPSLAFYSLALCAEAGYLAGLVAPSAVATAALLAGDGRLRRAALSALLGAELGFFLLAPSPIGRAYMMPDVSEILAREAVHQSLEETLTQGTAASERLLVLTDWPDPTALHQLPLFRPNADVLYFQDHGRYAFHASDAITLTTTIGAPTEGYEGRCDIRHDVAYDVVVLDPRSSDGLRSRIAAQSTCGATGPAASARRARFRASCFPGATIRGAECTFRFRDAAR